MNARKDEPAGQGILPLKTVVQRPRSRPTVPALLISTVHVAGDAYETMIFASDEDGEVSNHTDRYCRRYAHELEASVGHWEIVGYVSRGSFDFRLSDSGSWWLEISGDA